MAVTEIISTRYLIVFVERMIDLSNHTINVIRRWSSDKKIWRRTEQRHGIIRSRPGMSGQQRRNNWINRLTQRQSQRCNFARIGHARNRVEPDPFALSFIIYKPESLVLNNR